jgi:hypothetical protein
MLISLDILSRRRLVSRRTRLFRQWSSWRRTKRRIWSRFCRINRLSNLISISLLRVCIRVLVLLNCRLSQISLVSSIVILILIYSFKNQLISSNLPSWILLRILIRSNSLSIISKIIWKINKCKKKLVNSQNYKSSHHYYSLVLFNLNYNKIIIN